MRNLQRPFVPLLRFLGATETVTGSRFLVDTPRLGRMEFSDAGGRGQERSVRPPADVYVSHNEEP
jgi:hypothetical protein